MTFFCTDEHIDQMLIGRTRAILREIREIDSETTTGEAFRKYIRRWMDDLDRAMPVRESKEGSI